MTEQVLIPSHSDPQELLSNDEVFSRDTHDDILSLLDKWNGSVVRQLMKEVSNHPFIAFFLWENFDPKIADNLVKARNRWSRIMLHKDSLPSSNNDTFKDAA